MARITDVSELVRIAADDSPERLAVVEAGGRSLTWVALEDEVARVATGLGHLGALAGHRVMLVLGNRLEFVTSYLGVLRAQAVAVPVNPESTADELERMLGDCGARLVLAEPGTAATVREAARRLASPPRVVLVGDAGDGETSYAELVSAAPRPVPPLRDPDKLAALLYTSGTSGLPRGAMLSHRALLANIEQVAGVEPPMISGDDVVLGVLPLFHVYGLNAVLGGVLRHRAKLLLAERFDPQGTLEIIEDEACSVVPVAPAVFAHWLPVEHLAERLGPVRLLLSGSAPLSPEVVEQFVAVSGVDVHQGYGLTEAAPVVTSTLCSEVVQPGSVGTALPGIEVRLVDDRGGVPGGEDPGEISIRGDNLFSGYWPDGAGGPDADGWWATGDVGFLDPSGDLFLVDRLKELVIVSGFNVYPSEVEDVIREVPGVADAAVIGAPDEVTGESVVAYVVPAGRADGVQDAVRSHVGTRLARFKQPARIEVVEELPLTVTGKVQKGRLRGIERRRALGLLE
ncbi:class I adenylate-forming enzyme family protein [uncultured Nocardioides sp.]|uniref:class I adenylate-forming enzyme family protein n=1 Tax=uncultured Nocardioides sp. TaxID=198441 RepID=UPI0025FFC329|nr:AMP-binding protein [uncultured Nocardioides sp.]